MQGDTTTALAATLTAFHQKIRVAHVEAGLRTYIAREPFPEEMNRRVIDLICDLAFAPTHRAVQNLLAEGIPGQAIKLTGNTAVDAALYAAKQAPTVQRDNILSACGGRRLVLVTAHRRESFGQPLREIFSAVQDLARRYAAEYLFVMPTHPNPEVQSQCSQRNAPLS